MIKLLLVKLILTVATLMAAESCSRPNLNREAVFIYRTLSNVSVTVHRCLYNDSRNSYSDISGHCLSAFKTQSFLDKFGQTNNLKNGNSPIVLEDYTSKADPLKNLIYLKSGTTCRYDRGFCYDPSETVTYAAVWNVVPLPTEKCPSKLEQVFYGYVDLWTFAQEKLKYIFYYDSNSDGSFFLRLAAPFKCYNKQVWYTDDNGFIISLHSLSAYFRPTRKLDPNYFPLKSKRLISEAILEDCDLRSNPTDFNKHITADHLVDRENLKSVLNLLQVQIKNNSKSVDQCTSKFNNVKLFLENKNKEISGIKGAIHLYKSWFQKVNGSLNSLLQDRNGSNPDVSCAKDLSERINKFNISITKLEKDFKTLSTNKDDDKKKFINNLSNLGKEVDKKFNNFSVSFDRELEKLNKTLSQTKINILIDLEPLILSRINDSSNCNEKVNSLQHYIDKKLKDFIKESIIKTKALENKMIEYGHNIDKDILSKTTAFNSKLSEINKKIEDLEHNEVNYKNLIENEMKTYYDNITSIIDRGKIFLQNDIQEKYISLTEFIDAGKENIIKDIILLKDNIALDNDNLKTEINKTMSTKLDDFNNRLKTVNISLSKRLDPLYTDILDIMEKLKEFKTDMETNREANDLKINHLKEDVDRSIKLVTEAPDKIEQNILNKLNSTLNSVINQSNLIKENIENLKKGTDEKFKILKEEVIKVCELGDKTVYQNLTKMNTDISDDIKLKMINLENQLRKNNNLGDTNYKLIEKKLEEGEKNVNNLSDEVAQKYNSTLAILEDRTFECKKEIQGLQNGTNKSLEKLQNIYGNLTIVNNGFIKDLNKVNKSLINEINNSGSKIKELEDEVKELMSATRNKDNLTQTAIRDILDNLSTTNKNMNNLFKNLKVEVLSKYDPLLDSLNNQSLKCDEEVENLKNNFDKTLYDFKNQIFNNFSDSAENLRDSSEFINKKIDAVDKRIFNLENLEKSQTKTQRNLDVKINYLLNQTESTWKELNDNVKGVDNIKNIVNNLESKVNGLDANNSFLMSYLTNVNQTSDKNERALKKLQNELNLVNYSNSQSADFIKKQINEINADIQKGSNDFKEIQKENDKKFDNLTNDLVTSQQLLKNYEKEIELLKLNLSSSNKLLSESIQFTKSLQNQIDNIKLENEKNEIHLGYTISHLNNLIEKNENKTLEVKEELLNLRVCCNDNNRKLVEKDREIQDMKDKFRKEIKIIKEEQEKLKIPIEVEVT